MPAPRSLFVIPAAAVAIASLAPDACRLPASVIAYASMQDRAPTGSPAASRSAPVDLAGQLAAGALKSIARVAKPLPEPKGAVTIGEGEGPAVAWIDGLDMADGTIELELRGRDVLQRSFLGVAFNRVDDKTYEAIYLRPFNFRSTDPVRKQHAIQYVAMPEHDWPVLRKTYPEEFENPVPASAEPTGWVPLRVVIDANEVRAYVAGEQSPTLAVRRLRKAGSGKVGLWTGNGSDGAYVNLRVTPAR